MGNGKVDTIDVSRSWMAGAETERTACEEWA